jgi:RNA-directed DNA polymerase
MPRRTLNGHEGGNAGDSQGRAYRIGESGVRTAEEVEGSGVPKGNSDESAQRRTQRREKLDSALARVRAVAKRDKARRFTALWHHVYDVERLRAAYEGLKHDSAPGIDGETWKAYGEGLEAKLADLSGRLKRGAYRPPPVRRVYVPKAEGRRRAIGMPTVEDKIVQRATVEVLGAIYEADFLGLSYGYRPGRSAHDALDAVTVAIQARKVSWVLDADIRAFFDTLDHEWLVKFVEHRIGDRRVTGQIRRWLNAGVMEEGKRSEATEGTPQGGSASPLLANIYLHYVLDLWVNRWRRQPGRGEVVMVRYADDLVVGFQYQRDAERFQRELKERLGRFRLELAEEKTRLIEFGRFAARTRRERGEGKPETFDFLGFTHYCGRTSKGGFTVWRRTTRKRQRSKLSELKAELHRRGHEDVDEVGRWLRSVVSGHNRYYGVPGNRDALSAFRWELGRLWRRVLIRRSQRTRLSWARLENLTEQYLPKPEIHHPHPAQRLRVTT